VRVRGAATLGWVLGLAVFYAVAGKLSLQAASVNPSASPVWPPTGIALASLLVLGMRAWPAILAGAYYVNATTYGNPATSLGIAAGNTLEAVAGAWLVVRFARGRLAFERPLDYGRFVFLAGVLAPVISATVGVGSQCLGKFEHWENFGRVWSTWYVGDVGGAIVVAPLLLLIAARPPRLTWTAGRILEGVLVLLSVGLSGEIVFLGDWLPELSRRPLAILCLPPLLWAAFRFGPRETAITIAALLVVATWGTLHGLGPYASFGENESLMLLQAFIAICAVTAMSLAATVRQRERGQHALEDQARELARSNAELDQFASVATHDLQEPLRMIRIHAQMIDRGLQGRAGAEVDEHLAALEQGTARMQQLLVDLLAYARVGARPRDLQAAEGTDVLKEVLEDLRQAITETGARVTVGPMPRIQADRPQLGQLFRNLIANAIKFRRSGTPEVDVRGERLDGHWVFSVRDNGIGIPPDHRERIFEVFTRLHPRDRYPGTGMGLAICKKIVHRHGGRIWVESQPGSGSTFYFTLPVSE